MPHPSQVRSAVFPVSRITGLESPARLPFPQKNWFPTTSIDVISQNLSLRLHTLVYLDIQDDRYMLIPEAVALLEKMAEDKKMHIPLYVGIARAGSDNPLVQAGSAEVLRSIDFGPPLHILIVPAELHDMETVSTWRCLPAYED